MNPRHELYRRRNEYLSRLTYFDSFECPEDVDGRPAFTRRFLSGGDDVAPGSQPALHRPPLATGQEADDAKYRRYVHDGYDGHDKDKTQDNRSDQGDRDQFILPNYPVTDLNRITALVTRAIEWHGDGASLTPDQIFDVRAAAVPKADDKDGGLRKAYALLILAGYDENKLLDAWRKSLDGVDWTADAWDGRDGYTQLRGRLDGDVYGALTAYFRGHAPWTPKCPEQPPAVPGVRIAGGAVRVTEDTAGGHNRTRKAPPAPPKEPDGLPPDAATALAQNREALVAAFGDTAPETVVADLRAIPLKEDLVTRLLVWFGTSWDRVPGYWRAGFASERWRLDYGYEPYPNEDGVQGQDGGGELVDVQVGEQDAQNRWNAARRLLLLLRFLGRLNGETVREACLRLDALARFDLSNADTLAGVLEKPVDTWSDVDSDRFGDLGSWLGGIAWMRQRPDLVFLMTARMADAETFDRFWGTPGVANAAAARYPEASGSDDPTNPLRGGDDPFQTFPSPVPEEGTATDLELAVGAYYWRNVVLQSTLPNVLGLKDTSDFHVADHLRFLGLFRSGGRFRPAGSGKELEDWISGFVPDWFVKLASSGIQSFKFWVTDEKTRRSDEEEMVFWSENHQALFASGEYIAGQFFPDAVFSVRDGPGAQQTGAWHKERASARLERWLHDRLRFGFAEINSSVYYDAHLRAVFNTVDFVEDERLRTLGLMVLDLLMFDVVRHTCKGSFVAATSRVYSSNKTSGWAVSIRDLVEVFTGAVGDIGDTNEGAAIYLSTSRYLDECPETLLVIPGHTTPVVARARTSFGFDEAERYGRGFDSGDDAVFWWGHSAFFTDETYRMSQSYSERWHLRHTSVFKFFNWADNIAWRILDVLLEGIELFAFWTFLPMLGLFFYARTLRVLFDAASTILDLISSILAGIGKDLGLLDENDDRVRLAKTMIEEELEDAAIELNVGSVNGRLHFTMWRSADAALSSLANEHRALLSFQKEVAIANLGMNVSVFVNKPPRVSFDLIKTGVSGTGGALENVNIVGTAGGAMDVGGDPAPEMTNLLYSIGIPTGKESILGDDGPGFWFGQTSNPMVWQHENVAIAIFNPKGWQGDISTNTHAYWPWDHFDEVRMKDGGKWVFGRCDRRELPKTPDPPEPARRPSNVRLDVGPLAALGVPDQDVLWPPDFSRWEEPKSGSGYVALFCATEMKPSPVDAKGWGHKELIADGDKAIWVLIVGDRETYGSFDNFVSDVMKGGVDASIDHLRCFVPMPKPGAREHGSGEVFELTWDGGAKIGGRKMSTDGWPRFELKESELAGDAKLGYGVSSTKTGDRRVEWDETGWMIQADLVTEAFGTKTSLTLSLIHDFSDLQNPKRDFDEAPRELNLDALLTKKTRVRIVPAQAQSHLAPAYRRRMK